LAIIKNISFYQFKNYKEAKFSFSDKINCIYGKNGVGKTNILDAIYFACYTKSYFAKKESQLVMHEQLGMSVRAQIWKNDAITEINIKIKENFKKEILKNGLEIKQVQQYLGILSCVMIAPDDVNLISEGSEYRRKYLDAIISQTQPEYLSNLLAYNKVLLQRNALLKQWTHISTANQSVLQHYNAELAIYGTYIYNKRKIVAATLFLEIINIYNTISDSTDAVALSYNSQLQNNTLEALFNVNMHKDIASQRTNYGIHKDDIIITIQHNNLFKDFASQGQRKSMLFAFKLAQFLYLKNTLHQNPVLLLDDVFEKLDAQRALHLLKFIHAQSCQTIITDTHLQRLQDAFGPASDNVYYIQL
jgi:DNA replication and repair protein RecF